MKNNIYIKKPLAGTVVDGTLLVRSALQKSQYWSITEEEIGFGIYRATQRFQLLKFIKSLFGGK